jgi:hypothetical protein
MAATGAQSTDPGTALCGLCVKPHQKQDLIEARSYAAIKPFSESFDRVILVCPECERTGVSHCPVCGGAFLVDEHGSRDTKYEQATYEDADAELLACPACDPGGDWGYQEWECDDGDDELD